MKINMKAFYNFLRQPAQKFFNFANKKYHCLMWFIPIAVLETAFKSGTAPTLREVTAFAALMGYCLIVSIAARYFVRELNHPA